MDFDWSVIGSSLPYLWKGMQYTLELTVITALGGLFGAGARGAGDAGRAAAGRAGQRPV